MQNVHVPLHREIHVDVKSYIIGVKKENWNRTTFLCVDYSRYVVHEIVMDVYTY